MKLEVTTSVLSPGFLYIWDPPHTCSTWEYRSQLLKLLVVIRSGILRAGLERQRRNSYAILVGMNGIWQKYHRGWRWFITPSRE